MKKIKIAINGFGRIGRLFFRQAFKMSQFEIVAINDLGDIENLVYLLKYDTVHRAYDEDVSFKKDSSGSGGVLTVGGKDIKFLQIKDPTQLPWKSLDVDILVESTGVFNSYEKAKVHLVAGAKRLVITAPAKDPDIEGKTVLVGVNEMEAKETLMTSNGSCTTNSASPVIQVLSKNPGIQKALLVTVHAYTASQSVVDSPVRGSDFRRGRAAAQNITPSTTGAAIAVTRAIPELKDKFDGIALRVPVLAGSISDITFLAGRKTTAEEINDILRKASQEPNWQGILKVVDDQLVSSDILGMPYGAIIDSRLTKVVDGDLVKVLSWYDNESGYVSTLIKHVLRVSEFL